MGFARAFLKAGADNVIAWLWDVNDKSTMELMSHLYLKIAEGTDYSRCIADVEAGVDQGGRRISKAVLLDAV